MSRLAPISATAAPNHATGSPLICDRRVDRAAPGDAGPASAPWSVIMQKTRCEVEADLYAVASEHLSSTLYV